MSKADEWDKKDEKKEKSIGRILDLAEKAMPSMVSQGFRGNQNHVSMTLSDHEMELVGQLLYNLRGKNE